MLIDTAFMEILSIFWDTSAHSTINPTCIDQSNLTHQYHNLAKYCKPDEFLVYTYMYKVLKTYGDSYLPFEAKDKKHTQTQ